MTYLALGDSISIDLYTGVEGGGAASQLARLLGAGSFLDMTRDGKMCRGLVEDLDIALNRGRLSRVDAATVTIGGNDLLAGHFVRASGDRGTGSVSLEEFAANLIVLSTLLDRLQCPVVINTIYDPTDGDDTKAGELGLSPDARSGLGFANSLIRAVAEDHGFLLCDLELLFEGHGFWSEDPWIVMHIEPNLKGATKIAEAWHGLLGPALAEASRSAEPSPPR